MVDDELPLPLLGLLAPAPAPAPELPLPDDEAWATGLTAEMTPSTMRLLGISTVTCSPRTASFCELAARSTVTTRWVEELWRISVAVLPPLLLLLEALGVVPEEEDGDLLDGLVEELEGLLELDEGRGIDSGA